MIGMDRLQRIIMAVILIFLNLIGGDFSSITTSSFIALMVQIELLLTGIVGWCPLYWSASFMKKKT